MEVVNSSIHSPQQIVQEKIRMIHTECRAEICRGMPKYAAVDYQTTSARRKAIPSHAEEVYRQHSSSRQSPSQYKVEQGADLCVIVKNPSKAYSLSQSAEEILESRQMGK
jgi:hypothetical protein